MTPAQPSLFTEDALPPLVSIPAAGLTRAERLAAFDAANPHVFDQFRSMAWNDAATGCPRLFAMEYIYRIRKRGIRTVRDANGYSIPNEMATFYVRRLIEESPMFAALFVTRTSELDE
jgi:hypothetical protein